MMMQQADFSVDRARTPWNPPALYVPYEPRECVRIGAGLQGMLTVPGAKKELLIPLPPLIDGTVYYAAVTRVDRQVRTVQFRMEAMPSGSWAMRIRPIRVSDAVRDRYRSITFVSDQLQEVDGERLFWRVMRKSWEKAYDAVSVLNPQHVVLGGGAFGYDDRPVEGWTQALTPLVHQAVYNPPLGARIEIALHELRVPGGKTETLVVFDRLNKDHAVALIRTGTVINAVDLQFATYPVRTMWQRRAIFPPHINAFFPGVQFTSAQLSDAEKDALIQQPVLRHYATIVDGYVNDYVHTPRLTALAMSLHPRLSGGAGIGRLDREIIVLIAKLMMVRDQVV